MGQTGAWQFEILAEYDVLLEGPAWDGSGLLFTEIVADNIRRYDPETGRCDVWRANTNRANGLMFDREGRLYACEGGGRRMVRYDGDETTELASTFEGRRLNSPNDLAIDAEGRVWFTDPRYGNRDGLELDHESVYRLDTADDGTWQISRMTFDMIRPNGLLISPDQSTLYVAETPTDGDGGCELLAYAILADGTLGPKRVLHSFHPHRGIDGMCLDRDGNIVATAGWRASGPGPMIAVFSPEGDLLETHPLPVDYPTNCTFGGPDLTTLYVTSGPGQHGKGCLLRAETHRQGHLWFPPV